MPAIAGIPGETLTTVLEVFDPHQHLGAIFHVTEAHCLHLGVGQNRHSQPLGHHIHFMSEVVYSQIKVVENSLGIKTARESFVPYIKKK